MRQQEASAHGKRRLRHVVVSAGPTREPLDPVRFLSNYSTGFMGACVAAEALRRGHRVTLVSGPTECRPPRGARVVRVETARQLQEALRRCLPGADALIMAAAVSDFQAARPWRTKQPRRDRLRIVLKATPDILQTLPRRAGQVMVGFALETHQALARARQKLRHKQLDLVVAQQFSGAGQNGTGRPFGRHVVNAVLLSASGGVRRLGTVSKPRLARAILDEIEQLWYGCGTCLRPHTSRQRAGCR